MKSEEAVGGRKGTPIPVDQRKLPRDWTMVQAAYVLNCTVVTMFRYLNGTRYPEVRMMRRIERIFGWPATDQIQLIPYEGYDLTYGMVLRQVMEENGGHFQDMPPVLQPESVVSLQSTTFS